eukprot:gene5261-6090_t
MIRIQDINITYLDDKDSVVEQRNCRQFLLALKNPYSPLKVITGLKSSSGSVVDKLLKLQPPEQDYTGLIVDTQSIHSPIVLSLATLPMAPLQSLSLYPIGSTFDGKQLLNNYHQLCRISLIDYEFSHMTQDLVFQYLEEQVTLTHLELSWPNLDQARLERLVSTKQKITHLTLHPHVQLIHIPSHITNLKLYVGFMVINDDSFKRFIMANSVQHLQLLLEPHNVFQEYLQMDLSILQQCRSLQTLVFETHDNSFHPLGHTNFGQHCHTRLSQALKCQSLTSIAIIVHKQALDTLSPELITKELEEWSNCRPLNLQISKRNGKSKFNCIWEFKCNALGQQNVDMLFTSVLGHLKQTDVVPPYTNWSQCQPIDLFDVPVHKFIDPNSPNNLAIEETIKQEARSCDTIILWLDCDREGENIAFEVLETAQSVRPRIAYYRAHFSSIIPTAIKRAMETLTPPNQNDSWAVDTRMEIDLRLGAVFTRFQTLYLQSRYNISDMNGGEDSRVVSYGPCQFPTLGFVVERYLRIERFVPEDFWSILVVHQKISKDDKKSANFTWKRKRLFDHAAALVLFEKCLDNPVATVLDSTNKTMKLAESLYNKGFISYPRTETDSFAEGTDLIALIQLQSNNGQWGEYAQRLLNGEFKYPKSGRNNDNSHPPIHPTGVPTGITADEQKIYDFITRRFLACCSHESIFGQTTVTIDIAGEKFTETGSMQIRAGYLDVYPYDKRFDKSIPTYQVGETFMPKSTELTKGRTVSPKPISESELLSAMDNNKIGTDATMAQHIKKIVERAYVKKDNENRFIPTDLGKALIVGYDSMGFGFSKPDLRAMIEADVNKISTGARPKERVLADTIAQYKELFIQAQAHIHMLDVEFAKYFKPFGDSFKLIKKGFSRCGRCKGTMDIKESQGSTTAPFHCFQCTADCDNATGHGFKSKPPAATTYKPPSSYKSSPGKAAASRAAPSKPYAKTAKPAPSTYKKQAATPPKRFDW